MTSQTNVDGASIQSIVPRCGYCISVVDWYVHLLDVDGCLLPKGHEEPHEFRNHDGQLYRWEYDEDEDQDVFWKKP